MHQVQGSGAFTGIDPPSWLRYQARIRLEEDWALIKRIVDHCKDSIDDLRTIPEQYRLGLCRW